MTKLFVKTGRTYRHATRGEVLDWVQATIAAEIPGRYLTQPDDAGEFLQEALQLAISEQFVVVYLTARLQVMQMDVAFRGTVDHTPVFPREIVRRAVELGAAAVIVAHNHPSGVPEPSEADRLITRRLRAALELVDVRVLDHLIIAPRAKPVSLAARGLI